MQKLKILNTREVKGILNSLKEQFGYSEKPNYSWLISGKEKLYVVNSDLNKIDLNVIRIDSIGLYFGEYKDNQIRLSLEGSILISKKIDKNIIELNEEERNSWLMGNDLKKDLGDTAKFVVLKCKNDIIGCGRYKEKNIFNSISKERRLRVIANLD